MCVSETENSLLKDKLEKTEKRCQKLEERLFSLETASRRNNLKFVPMTRLISNSWQNCDCNVLVMNLCGKYGINFNQSSIERAHRVNARQKDAPIIVKLLKFKDKLRILREKQKMRENGILVVEDFPSEVIHRRRQFSTVLKAAYNSPKTTKLICQLISYFGWEELHNSRHGQASG